MKTLVLAVLCIAAVGMEGRSSAQPAAAPSVQPVAGCTKDTDCKGDRICDAGVCKANPNPPPAAPACSKDTDCAGSDVCMSGVCTASSAMPAPVSPAPAPSPVTSGPNIANPPTPITTGAPQPIAQATTALPPPPRRSGWAGSVTALIAFQAWSNSGSPGGYPVPSASGVTYAFMETSAIGGYVGHSDGTDYALNLVDTANYDGDGTYYGMVGLGVRGTSKDSKFSLQGALGLNWTEFSDGSDLLGFAMGFEMFAGPKAGILGFTVSSELDVAPASVGTDITFTIGIGGGLFR